MRYLFILTILLSSCSATYHLKRALKKDPNIIKADTLVVEKIIEGPSDTIVGEDSVKIDNDRIWIEAFGLGKITLNYKVKDVIIHDTTEVTSVVIPEKPRQTKQRERTNRKKIKEDGKTARVQIKYKYKTIKVTEQKNDLLYIGIAIGLAISYLVYRLYKRFFS